MNDLEREAMDAADYFEVVAETLEKTGCPNQAKECLNRAAALREARDSVTVELELDGTGLFGDMDRREDSAEFAPLDDGGGE